MLEKTYIMVKPDGVKRGLVGEIIRRIEAKGYKIVDLRLMRPNRELVVKHYDVHKDKPFFGELVDFISDSEVVGMVVEGEDVITVLRNMIGDKNPAIAASGTIRGDYANSLTKNIIHGSDSAETAEREISIWF